MSGLYVLLTIVRRTDAKEYEEFYKKHGISVLFLLQVINSAEFFVTDYSYRRGDRAF